MMLTGILNMGLSLTDTAMMGWLDPLALAGGVLVSDFYSFAFYFAAPRGRVLSWARDSG